MAKFSLHYPATERYEILRVERNSWKVNPEEIKKFVSNININELFKKAVEDGFVGISTYYEVFRHKSNGKIERVIYAEGYGTIEKRLNTSFGVSVAQISLEWNLHELIEKIKSPCIIDLSLFLRAYSAEKKEIVELPSPCQN